MVQTRNPTVNSIKVDRCIYCGSIDGLEREHVVASGLGGYRRGEGSSLVGLAISYAQLGETRNAIEHYERTLTIVREIGDRRAEGHTLGNLGGAYVNLGEIRRGKEHYERSHARLETVGARGMRVTL
jgi:tetratricopeptide (TPR) repeat protein